MKYSMFVSGILALLLTACGAQAAPTVDPAQVQASAIAAASTMVAATQAAIPTATATLEASPTPLPSPTPFELPTLDILSSPTIASQSGTDNCVHPLDMGAAGRGHPTLLKNESSGTVNLSLNLYQPNAFGQCGAISYANITKNSSILAQLPAGNWYAYAWGSAKGTNYKATGYFFVQPANFDKLDLCIRDSVIVYKPQC